MPNHITKSRLLLGLPELPPNHALPHKAQVPSARGIAKPPVACRLFMSASKARTTVNPLRSAMHHCSGVLS
jgi:hypothetical protein